VIFDSKITHSTPGGLEIIPLGSLPNGRTITIPDGSRARDEVVVRGIAYKTRSRSSGRGDRIHVPSSKTPGQAGNRAKQRRFLALGTSPPRMPLCCLPIAERRPRHSLCSAGDISIAVPERQASPPRRVFTGQRPARQLGNSNYGPRRILDHRTASRPGVELVNFLEKLDSTQGLSDDGSPKNRVLDSAGPPSISDASAPNSRDGASRRSDGTLAAVRDWSRARRKKSRR